MPVVRWTFEDPALAVVYTFEINPNAGGSPGFKKNVREQATCAPNGGVIVFEGRDEPSTFEFSGTILTQTHYNAFYTWWAKRRQIKVTDDLGRVTWIYLTEFQPQRVIARSFPWKHTYTCRAVVVVGVV